MRLFSSSKNVCFLSAAMLATLVASFIQNTKGVFLSDNFTCPVSNSNCCTPNNSSLCFTFSSFDFPDMLVFQEFPSGLTDGLNKTLTSLGYRLMSNVEDCFFIGSPTELLISNPYHLNKRYGCDMPYGSLAFTTDGYGTLTNVSAEGAIAYGLDFSGNASRLLCDITECQPITEHSSVWTYIFAAIALLAFASVGCSFYRYYKKQETPESAEEEPFVLSSH